MSSTYSTYVKINIFKKAKNVQNNKLMIVATWIIIILYMDRIIQAKTHRRRLRCTRGPRKWGPTTFQHRVTTTRKRLRRWSTNTRRSTRSDWKRKWTSRTRTRRPTCTTSRRLWARPRKGTSRRPRRSAYPAAPRNSRTAGCSTPARALTTT